MNNLGIIHLGCIQNRVEVLDIHGEFILFRSVQLVFWCQMCRYPLLAISSPSSKREHHDASVSYTKLSAVIQSTVCATKPPQQEKNQSKGLTHGKYILRRYIVQ